jgi:hypothetical protein
MKVLFHLSPIRNHPLAILAPALLLIALSFTKLTAGTGGVEGGCSYAKNSNGKTTYAACSGANSPMWYSTSANPAYSEGDLPCGFYGNQDCGMITGDPLNE